MQKHVNRALSTLAHPMLALEERLEDLELEKRIQHARLRIFNRRSLVQYGDTPFEVHYDNGLAKLRRYLPLKNHPKRYRTPLLFVTPLAVGTEIYDLLESRSLVKFLLKQGFDVFMIDWGVPTRKQSHYGFSYYVSKVIPDIVKAVRDASGSQDISIHGWSMGGLFSVIYAAYAHDHHVKNLILCGTPIDGHASGSLGKAFNLAGTTFDKIEKTTGLHPVKLPTALLHSQGWMNMLAFKAIDPLGTVKSYWHMFKNLADEEALRENATKADFLINMFDYPGAIIKDIALRFWFSNSLIKGEYTLDGKTLDLSHIVTSLYVIAGTSDALVTPAAARPIIDIIDSDDTSFVQVPGGHVGILSSKTTQQNLWPQMAKWLAQRSEAI